MNTATRCTPLTALAALFLLACLASAAGVPAAGAQQCPNLVWADEFDGSAVDTTKWSYQTGGGGWGNNELQYYRPENATVSGGTLKITADDQRFRGNQYTSTRMRTLNQGDFFFGRFEARIKMTVGQGIWPAFWMMPTDEVHGGWPQSGEIDIMENIGSQPSTTHGTIHFGDPWPDNSSSGGSFSLTGGARFTDGWHEFAVEKEAGEIRWYVDDIHFSTKTSADTDPHLWVFDERFHFILNVAVGGDWPGSPDATTVFPQVLEVDYVRVYDGDFPSIGGDRVVPHQAAGVVYSVANAPTGSTYSWTVPAGATIVSGQGTSSITVDFGAAGGDVAADVTSACGNELLTIDVDVEAPLFFDFSFESFDAPANVTLGTATGTLTEVANPDPSGVNTSALSGEYVRNSGEQFDVLFYSSSSIPDASEYVTTQRKFVIDVYTSAPVGSELLIQLEDSALASPTNFPTGRHSRYQVFTGVQNQWERLEVGFLDTPDPGTGDVDVDDIVLLFAPNGFTGDTYYFDNFDSYLAGTPGGNPPAAPTSLSATAASSSQIDLAWSDNSGDEDGFRVERSTDGSNFSEIDTVGADTTSYNDTGLAAETTYFYQVRAFNANGNSAYSNVASDTTDSAGQATTMHVDSIVLGTQNAGQGNKHGTATVTLVDDNGAAVESATVTGDFTGDFNETAMGTTAAGGTVTLLTNGVKKGGVTLTFCVTNVTHATLTYDPVSNVTDCGSL